MDKKEIKTINVTVDEYIKNHRHLKGNIVIRGSGKPLSDTESKKESVKAEFPLKN